MYRGYPIAVVVFLSTGLTIGTSQYAFGEFAAPLRDHFGWSQTELNLSLTLAVISGLLAPVIGRAADRWGARPVTVISLLLVAAGFLLRPLIDSLWHWYLFSALVYAGFPGATTLPAGKLVGLWFPATRGRVMGAVTAGNNAGGLTMPPLAAAMIALGGWQWGFLAFGAVLLLLALVAWVTIREDEDLVAREMRASGRSGAVHASRQLSAQRRYPAPGAAQPPLLVLDVGAVRRHLHLPGGLDAAPPALCRARLRPRRGHHRPGGDRGHGHRFEARLRSRQ